MSPTIFRYGSYRFLFFSREETRVHIHALGPDGEAKFWLDPAIELAKNHGLSEQQLQALEKVVREREQEIRDAWHRHFGT